MEFAPVKFIHLTDTHLVAGEARLYGGSPRDRLAAALDHIRHHHADASFVAVTGDLAESGEPEAYQTLRRLLGSLPMPFYLALGNHDDREAFAAVFPEVPRDRGGFVQYAVPTPLGVCLFLDTLDPGASPGLLCEARLAWLAETLGRHREADVFLFLHHPPLDVGIGSMDRRGLAGREELFRLLADHGSVRHLFCGHLHRPLSGSWRGIAYTCQKSTSHQVDLILAPGETTIANLEPPAYSVVLADADRLTVHHCDYGDGSPRFDLRDPAAKAAKNVEELRRLGSGGAN